MYTRAILLGRRTPGGRRAYQRPTRLCSVPEPQTIDATSSAVDVTSSDDETTASQFSDDSVRIGDSVQIADGSEVEMARTTALLTQSMVTQQSETQPLEPGSLESSQDIEVRGLTTVAPQESSPRALSEDVFGSSGCIRARNSLFAGIMGSHTKVNLRNRWSVNVFWLQPSAAWLREAVAPTLVQGASAPGCTSLHQVLELD